MRKTARGFSAAPARVCVANTAEEIAGLFREIESAVAAGLTAAGFFTYECGTCFEPKAGMRARPCNEPLAWIGIYERAYRFDHARGTFPDGEPPGLEKFRSGSDEPEPELAIDAETRPDGSAIRRTDRGDPRVDSRRRCVSTQLHGSHERACARQCGRACMRACANGSQWSMGHLFTGRPGGGFSRFRQSCSSDWNLKTASGALPRSL